MENECFENIIISTTITTLGISTLPNQHISKQILCQIYFTPKSLAAMPSEPRGPQKRHFNL